MKTIVGNWKMNGDAALAATLVDAVAEKAAKAAATVVLCPPATLIGEVARRMVGSKLHLGGQDCHTEAQGAHTGDVSASMLCGAGCGYVIVGHSERRAGHFETSDIVRKKAAQAIRHKLIPIICIGETLSERETGAHEAIVEGQVMDSLPDEASGSHFLLAYEPVWAIGSGRSATVSDIAAMHAHIKRVAAKKLGIDAGKVSVLYGGSVNAANAREILTIAGVSGVLVGGASLKAEEFCKIIESGAI